MRQDSGAGRTAGILYGQPLVPTGPQRHRRDFSNHTVLAGAPLRNRTVDLLLPCMPDSSDTVVSSPITAGQTHTGVWVRRALSVIALDRCHLVCHWRQGHLSSERSVVGSGEARARHDHGAITMILVPQRALVSRLCHYRKGTGGPELASAARHALTNRFDISSAATSPSLGLLDMVAPLTRVRGNIRAFGVTRTRSPWPESRRARRASADCLGACRARAVRPRHPE